MIRLSIAIVSYNVKFYVQQCIEAIELSTFQDVEIIIIDNNSTDGSADFLTHKYGNTITLIRNTVNKGFGTACNQALAIAKGDFTLFLNPDTIVQKQTLQNAVNFAEKTNNLGLLGARMLNENGSFLAESKRGIPTPQTSFFRVIGLNRLFSASRTVNDYYAPHLDEHEVGKVDVISGAFMLGSTQRLRELKGFDERFFMYGEDVDISYRFLQAGYDNYYLGSETIVHHKGKSTDKLSADYLNQFYGAMSIFHKKHFKDSYSWLFNLLISLAIFIRKSLGGLSLVAKHALLPLFELCVFIGGGYFIQFLWSSLYFGDENYYQHSGATINLILYSIIWILCLIFGSTYRYYTRRGAAISQLVLGLICILVMYSLLPSEWRSSRALIGLYFIWNAFALICLRTLYSLFKKQDSVLDEKLALVAAPHILDIINTYGISQHDKNKMFVPVAPSLDVTDHRYIGAFENILSICEDNKLRCVLISMEGFDLTEVKACADELSAFHIQTLIIDQHDIKNMLVSTVRQVDLLDSLKLEYKILFLENKLIKRGFDVVMSTLLLPISVVHSKINLSSLIKVILNRQSLVGYHTDDVALHKLPMIKTGLIPVSKRRGVSDDVHVENLNYALHYSIFLDFKCLINFLL